MNSKIKLLLVVNPISGGSGKEQLTKDLQTEIENHNVSLDTFETTGNNDEQQIQRIVETKHINRILVAGGDGTIQLVAKAIEGKDIAIGLIPAGSANGLVSNLNLPDTIEKQVEVALGKHFIMMDIISVNRHLCLHIADVGINAELIKNYENSTLRGKLGYALQTIPTLIESELPYNFSLEINGEKLQKEGIMIAIANANQFGTGAMVNPDGKMDDGFFEVLVFKNMDVIKILKTLGGTLERDAEFVECFTTKSVKIQSEKAVSLQVDGEFIGEVTKVEAKLYPSKLKIMVQDPTTLISE